MHGVWTQTRWPYGKAQSVTVCKYAKDGKVDRLDTPSCHGKYEARVPNEERQTEMKCGKELSPPKLSTRRDGIGQPSRHWWMRTSAFSCTPSFFQHHQRRCKDDTRGITALDDVMRKVRQSQQTDSSTSAMVVDVSGQVLGTWDIYQL